MKRYFFDVASKSYVQYDYRGREFDKPENACELAELIALDLECSDDGNWAGSEVRVHDAVGTRLCSILVGQLDQLAA